jgi:hypothetical protein
MMERNESEKRIANVLTRESAAKLKVVGAVLLAWIVGAVAESFLAGVALLLVLLVPIWRTYTGNQIAHKWFRNTVSAFWIALGGFAVLIVGVSWWASVNAPKTAEVPMTPELPDKQVLVDRIERSLVEHIKSQMQDPSSFDMADETVYDRGSYLVMKIRFRGSNALGATVLSQASMAVSLEGKVLSVSEIQ